MYTCHKKFNLVSPLSVINYLQFNNRKSNYWYTTFITCKIININLNCQDQNFTQHTSPLHFFLNKYCQLTGNKLEQKLFTYALSQMAGAPQHLEFSACNCTTHFTAPIIFNLYTVSIHICEVTAIWNMKWIKFLGKCTCILF
jgi:hypothetical protein